MSDCIIWTGCVTPKGYGKLRRNGKDYRAHRLAYIEAHGLSMDDIKGQVVRHTCDNPPCINPDHLLIGSVADNNEDRDQRGRQAKGSKHGLSKLEEHDIPKIRAMLAQGEPQDRIAHVYGVSQFMISLIKRGKTWRHVP